MSSNIWTPGASIIPSGMLGECMPWHSFFLLFFFPYLWKHLIGYAARNCSCFYMMFWDVCTGDMEQSHKRLAGDGRGSMWAKVLLNLSFHLSLCPRQVLSCEMPLIFDSLLFILLSQIIGQITLLHGEGMWWNNNGWV